MRFLMLLTKFYFVLEFNKHEGLSFLNIKYVRSSTDG